MMGEREKIIKEKWKQREEKNEKRKTNWTEKENARSQREASEMLYLER
jgi:hypothetical protein